MKIRYPEIFFLIDRENPGFREKSWQCPCMDTEVGGLLHLPAALFRRTP
jgi:hypothetical protein